MKIGITHNTGIFSDKDRYYLNANISEFEYQTDQFAYLIMNNKTAKIVGKYFLYLDDIVKGAMPAKKYNGRTVLIDNQLEDYEIDIR